MTRYLVEEQSDMTAKKKVRTMCGVQYISYIQQPPIKYKNKASPSISFGIFPARVRQLMIGDYLLSRLICYDMC